MSMFDSILGQVTGNSTVTNLAAKLGLSPDHVESAIRSLAQQHQMQGDTVAGAAAATGLPMDKLQEIFGQIGGEGSLGRFASLLQEGGAGGLLGALDKDGDGNPLNDLTKIATGFFGKK